MKNRIPIEIGPVTKERWLRLTLPQQLCNIGSEFSMYVLLLKKEAFIDAKKSLTEVLRLIDLAIIDNRWLNRIDDLNKFRKTISDTASAERVTHAAAEKLQDYLLSFALLARK